MKKLVVGLLLCQFLMFSSASANAVHVRAITGAPQDLRVTKRTATSITLEWTEPKVIGGDGNVHGYGASYSTDGGKLWSWYGNSMVTSPLEVKGLRAGQKYLFQVFALDGGYGAPALVSDRTRAIGTPINLSSGSSHVCMRDSMFRIYCWGDNHYGQTGESNVLESLQPVKVLDEANQVVSGDNFSCAIVPKPNSGYDWNQFLGDVKCWGKNDKGQLGNGTTTDSSTPTQVQGLFSTVNRIIAGPDFACAIKTGHFTNRGFIKCWGANQSHQLGSFEGAYSSSPVEVATTNGRDFVRTISAGPENVCALFVYQLAGMPRVECWGDGELSHTFPTEAATDIQAFSTGSNFFCYTGKSGSEETSSTQCAGDNSLGDWANNTSTVYRQLDSREGLSCGADEVDGSTTIACWGDNTNGVFSSDLNDSSDSSIISIPKSIVENSVIGSGYLQSVHEGSFSIGVRNFCYIRLDYSVGCFGQDAPRWQECVNQICSVHGLGSSLVTIAASPTAISKLVGTSSKAKTNKLTWSGAKSNGSAITKYEVHWKLSTSKSWGAWKSYGKATTATVTGWLKNKKYNVQVRVTNAVGSAVSKTFTITQTK